jgi:hypothetical protein
MDGLEVATLARTRGMRGLSSKTGDVRLFVNLLIPP